MTVSSPARCQFLLVAIVAAVSIVNILYLTINCPFDLSGDQRKVLRIGSNTI